ncbi:MAG: DUF1007 family protein [Alphaproteobacteria bacterium]|nr:DUF1007 family protein [Alphaproteobacteria bacterium]
MLCALLFTWASASLGQAHPHVWVTVESQIVHAADGSAVGVRHAWTFDDAFSAFALQGIHSKKKGLFTREELAPLAEVNVTSLREYKFFTFAKANGRRVPFNEPVDYWLDYANGLLTLHFTLPLKAPVVVRTLDIEIYDPSFFVFFEFAPKAPVTLRGGPSNCKLAIERPKEIDIKQAQSLSEEFFNALTASASWGAQFTNKVALRCP